jgi:hypothetical protein
LSTKIPLLLANLAPLFLALVRVFVDKPHVINRLYSSTTGGYLCKHNP